MARIININLLRLFPLLHPIINPFVHLSVPQQHSSSSFIHLFLLSIHFCSSLLTMFASLPILIGHAWRCQVTLCETSRCTLWSSVFSLVQKTCSPTRLHHSPPTAVKAFIPARISSSVGVPGNLLTIFLQQTHCTYCRLNLLSKTE